MASMKEHLANFHKRESEHHTVKAAHHSGVADHYTRLAKFAKTTTTEATKDSQGILEALAAMHTEQSQEHSGMADYHSECAEKCSKAMDSDLEKLVPTNVSAVAPDRPNIRAVPRYGQREMPVAVASPELSKILGVGEDDLHSDERSLA